MQRFSAWISHTANAPWPCDWWLHVRSTGAAHCLSGSPAHAQDHDAFKRPPPCLTVMLHWLGSELRTGSLARPWSPAPGLIPGPFRTLSRRAGTGVLRKLNPWWWGWVHRSFGEKQERRRRTITSSYPRFQARVPGAQMSWPRPCDTRKAEHAGREQLFSASSQK